VVENQVNEDSQKHERSTWETYDGEIERRESNIGDVHEIIPRISGLEHEVADYNSELAANNVPPLSKYTL